MLTLISLLAAATAAVPESATEDSAMHETRSQRIVEAFNGLSMDTMDQLGDFYAQDVVFEDPLGRIEGLARLRAYYEGMYKNVQAIRFDFTNEVVQGDTHVAVWTMTMEVKGLNRGRPVVVDGNSVIRFDAESKVVYHRDYFDVGAMVYEHVPVVKTLVKAIKKRLAKH
jgi:limonene-1,2-epoxide hydrolase